MCHAQTMGGDGGEHPATPDLRNTEVEAWTTNGGLQPPRFLVTQGLRAPRPVV